MQLDLADQGWSEPVVIASGNGIQLWYRIDLEKTEENCSLLKNVLAGLSLRYSTAHVDIDESTATPLVSLAYQVQSIARVVRLRLRDHIVGRT